MTHSSLLSDLIDLNSALKSDSSTELGERKKRDRRIGQALEQERNNPVKQIRGWLDQVEIRGLRHNGHSGAQLYQLLSLILGLLGLAAGWGLARAVLHYTGDAPINIFNALGLLVFPQIVLVLFWVVFTIPRKIPLLSSLQSALGFLNPGRLAKHLAQLFPEKGQKSLSVVWDAENAAALAPTSRWLLSFWSQLFAFLFNVGVLLTVFYIISFSDLAFVWSTTLNLDNTTFHRTLGIFSWPWHTLFPDAVPNAELIEISRYYRLEDSSISNEDVLPEFAAQLGSWWPFLVAAIVSYGLLPRMVTLIISWFRFRHHLGHALLGLPGSPELLARMNSPLVTTTAPEPEIVPESSPSIENALVEAGGYRVKCAVVHWSGAANNREMIEKRLNSIGIDPQVFVMAGGNRSTDQDNEAIDLVCNNVGEGIAVIVKSWEPPLLEFLDFIRNIRKKCCNQQPLIVLLWGGQTGVADHDSEVWQLTLRQLKDPNLHVEVIGSVK